MSVRRLTAVTLGAAAMLAFLTPPLAARQSAKAVSEGVYTAAQASRGKQAYTDTCEACHKDDLSGFGDGMALPLAGEEFVKAWSGKTLADLFEKVQTMPPGEETKVTDAQRADIIAYILSVNHYTAGQAEMKPDATALKQVTIDAPKH